MRYIEPITPDKATGLLARTYALVEEALGGQSVARNGPFLAHSADPELLAAMWSIAYEAVLVDGRVPRANKHAIAAVVSEINQCTFCVQTHAFYSGLEGDRNDMGYLLTGAVEGIANPSRRRLSEWAAATRDPQSELLRDPPFTPEEAPEAIGTAVAFHYVDRVVSFYHGIEGVDVGDTPFSVVEGLVQTAIDRPREPGRSLREPTDAALPEDLRWAASSPPIAAAFAGFVAAVEKAGAAVLEEPERACVAAAIDAWDGAEPPLGSGWIDDTLAGLEPGSARDRARLALMAALAPNRVDAETVEAFRRERPHDREVLGAVAWAASRIARRVSSWLATPEAARIG